MSAWDRTSASDIGPGGQSVGQAAPIRLSAKARRRKVTPASPLAQKENPGPAAVARIAQRRHRSASMGLFTDQLTDQ
jgi:hypothetical protein